MRTFNGYADKANYRSLLLDRRLSSRDPTFIGAVLSHQQARDAPQTQLGRFSGGPQAQIPGCLDMCFFVAHTLMKSRSNTSATISSVITANLVLPLHLHWTLGFQNYFSRSRQSPLNMRSCQNRPFVFCWHVRRASSTHQRSS